MQNFLNLFIKELWQKSKCPSSLVFYEKIIFRILCFFDYFYRLGFFVVQTGKKYFGSKIVHGAKIISVGNLSVGGTGKTVFIEFLARQIGLKNVAIVSRGYGSKSAGKNLLVCDGSKIFGSPEVCGDEPYMLAKNLSVPVVVGVDRYRSCLIVKQACPAVEYVLLDDAYQNYQLTKDFEILLIDARFPLGVNGHCLPAGDLREIDYSRADLIILTHADLVLQDQIEQIKNKIFCNLSKSKIYCAVHKNVGLFQQNLNELGVGQLSTKKFMIVAGIGSISGFEKSVKSFGVVIDKVLEFPDHYFYSRNDVDQIICYLQSHELDGVIVTQKDWVKLSLILNQNESKYFFVFRVEFEFLSQAEYSSFVATLESILK